MNFGTQGELFTRDIFTQNTLVARVTQNGHTKDQRMPSRKKRSRKSQSQFGNDEEYAQCPNCLEEYAKKSLNRHLGQCRNRHAPPGGTGTEDDDNWLQAHKERDDPDVGFWGAEDNIDMNQDVMEDAAENVGKATADDSCGEEDEDDGDAILKNDDKAPPELLVKPGKEGDKLEGKVVKVSNFRSTWMNFLIGDDEEPPDPPPFQEDNENNVVVDEANKNEVPTTKKNEIPTVLGVCGDQTLGDEGGVPEALSGRSLLDEYNKIPESERMNYSKAFEYSSPQPKVDELPLKSPLRALLVSPEGKSLGSCWNHKQSQPQILLNGQELSMIRLINYCDQTKTTSRDFVNGFLDIVAEEMENEERRFDPRTHPARETVSRKVMKTYGAGCEPTILHVAVSNEKGPVVLQENTQGEPAVEDGDLVDLDEEQIQQSDVYKTTPQEIDNRERFMIDVICFNTRNMILDLLEDDEIFGNLDNLVVNKKNPYMPYENTGDVSEEVLDGSWYSDTIKRLENDPEDPFKREVEFILPIMMYVDKTGTSMNQRYPLEPFIFTTAIIRRKLRNKPTSWRPLGFIPDLETKSSAERAWFNRENRGSTAQAYHQALAYLLEGMEKVQEEGIVTWLCLGGHKKRVRIRPEVACIINDGKSADMTTLREPGFFPWKRVSRCCKTLMHECDLPTKQCKYLELTDELRESFRVVSMSAKEVQEDPKYQSGDLGEKPTDEEAQGIVESAKAKLLELNFHPVRNAFIARCIRFGLDPRNIWGANPIDLMHAFQSGILMYVVKMVLDQLKPQSQMKLDRLVHKLFHGLRSKDKESYPRVNFTKGFTKLTMITSDEWAGKLFVILVVLQTEEGAAIFKKANVFETDETKFIEIPEDWRSYEMAHLLASAKHAEERSHRIEVDSEVDKKMRGRAAAVEAEVLRLRAKKNKGKMDEEKLREQVEGAMREKLREEVEAELRGKAARPGNSKEDAARMDKEEEKKKKKAAMDEPEEMLRKCAQHDFTELAEALLCFHAWYKMGVCTVGKDKKVNTKLIQNAVARLLGMVRWYVPRKKGNRWKLQKFHDLLHLALDIERFGPPSNFDAGPMESGLRYWAKLPAMTSQMRGYNTFAKQVAMRTYEFQSFSKAMRLNRLARDPATKSPVTKSKQKGSSEGENATDKDDKKAILKGTTFRVYATSPTGELPSGSGLFRPTEISSKNAIGAVAISPVIENYLRFVAMNPANAPEPEPGNEQKKKEYTSTDHLPLHKDSTGALFWELKTEASIYIEDQKGRFDIRCHPNYGSEGPWYDWVIVNFEVPEELVFEELEHKTQYSNSCVPCKVLALAENPEKEGDVWLLVHGCNFRPNVKHSLQDSVLLEHWELAYEEMTGRLTDEIYRRFLPKKKSQTEKGVRKRKAGKEHKDESTPYRVPQLCWVKASSVHSRCFVIEEKPGIFENVPLKKNGKEGTKVLLVRHRAKWAQEFC